MSSALPNVFVAWFFEARYRFLNNINLSVVMSAKHMANSCRPKLKRIQVQGPTGSVARSEECSANNGAMCGQADHSHAASAIPLTLHIVYERKAINGVLSNRLLHVILNYFCHAATCTQLRFDGQ